MDAPTSKKINFPLVPVILLIVGLVAGFFVGGIYQTQRFMNSLENNPPHSPEEFTWNRLPTADINFPVSVKPHWTKGDPGSRVRYGLFLDLECPYCRQFIIELLPELLRRDDVYLEMYDLPIPELHPEAVLWSSYARCVADRDSDGYIDFITRVSQLDVFSDENMQKVIYDMGVYTEDEADALQECVQEKNPLVEEVANGVRSVGINGTPFSIINGRALQGYVPYDYFLSLIETVR